MKDYGAGEGQRARPGRGRGMPAFEGLDVLSFFTLDQRARLLAVARDVTFEPGRRGYQS